MNDINELRVLKEVYQIGTVVMWFMFYSASGWLWKALLGYLAVKYTFLELRTRLNLRLLCELAASEQEQSTEEAS